MIRVWKRHPGFFALSRYVDRGEDSADLGRIRTHLRDCPRCRDEVAWIHRLRGESCRLVDLEPPAGTLDNILARRADGERLILPVDALPTRRTRGPARLVGAGAVVTILAIVATVSLTNRATAGSNNLSFTPRFTQPGDEIEVRYVPTIALAGADSLRLRVRFRTAGQAFDEEMYEGNYLSLPLFPDHDGVFETRFELPATLAYAQMAIEDTYGETVDSNNRRLWEILTYDEGGEVLYEALRQRGYLANVTQDWRRTEETSAEMTRLFPGRAEGWYRRFLHELQYADQVARESALAIHSEAFRRLESELEGREMPGFELAAMMDYASALGEEAAADYWEGQLTRREPGNHRLARTRVAREARERSGPAKLLAVFQDAWLASEPRDGVLAGMALGQALRSEQWDLAETWARRWSDVDPSRLAGSGRRLATHPRLRAVGIEYLRRAVKLAERETDWMRPLGLDREHYERAQQRRLQDLLVDLADALLASGVEDEARELMARAADLAWEPNLLLEIAEHRVELGDTAVALDLLARVAADPLTEARAEERGHELLAATGLDQPNWMRSVGAERVRLLRWILAESDFRRLSPDIGVESVGGERVTVSSLSPSAPTLVAISALLSGRLSEARVRNLEEIYERLTARDIPFIVLATWGERSEFKRFVAGQGFEYPVYYDANNVASQVFGVSRLAEYVVLDSDGILRGTYTNLDEALRLLFLLPRPQVA